MNHANSNYAATFLRLALGTMFLAHGLLKIVVYTLPGTAQFFDAVGLPGFLAYPVAVFEVAGGIALILGIYVRPIAVGGIPLLAGATWAHLGNGWVFTAANGGWEYPAFLLVASVAVALLGAGAFAVQRHPIN